MTSKFYILKEKLTDLWQPRSMTICVGHGTNKNEDGVDIKCLVLHSSKETDLSTLSALDKESLGHDFTSTNVGSFSRHTTFFYSTEGRHCDAHDEVPLEEWNLHDDEEMKDESEGLAMWKIIAISVGGTLGFALIVAVMCYCKFRS
ncbi:LOW QUALITY PROTEIN: hypothetical protein MAR_034946 [Mya arenaria]|uniref:Uncharacterized protein n=1 Tax=Mya arenaria TaxID=6604 RepID=A0ABY7EJ18_MYAAR|nr:LOW QUALITY PROTEIN: hypothetical protein MAR_034946 [Mya arenaria]